LYYTNNRLNYIMVGYYDTLINKTSLACYKISSDNSTQSIDFKAALEISSNGQVQPSAYIFNNSKGDLRIIATHPMSGKTVLYSLSDKVRVTFHYSDISHFE